MTKDNIPTRVVPIENQFPLPTSLNTILSWTTSGFVAISAIFGLPRKAYTLCYEYVATPFYVQASKFESRSCTMTALQIFFNPLMASNAFSQQK